MSGASEAQTRSSPAFLAARALLWTILLPGVVAGYVPWRFFGVSRVRFESLGAASVPALLSIAAGAALLAACIVEFARSGRGTLSPADPPRHLVVRGLYRYVRNPMYLSVTLIIIGEVLLTKSPMLAVYWGMWFVAANLFVVGYEEPALHRRFGASYEIYTRQVGRWIPRLPRGSSQLNDHGPHTCRSTTAGRGPMRFAIAAGFAVGILLPILETMRRGVETWAVDFTTMFEDYLAGALLLAAAWAAYRARRWGPLALVVAWAYFTGMMSSSFWYELEATLRGTVTEDAVVLMVKSLLWGTCVLALVSSFQDVLRMLRVAPAGKPPGGAAVAARERPTA